jgi:hypothetical protein
MEYILFNLITLFLKEQLCPQYHNQYVTCADQFGFVLLFVLSFCFLEIDCKAPSPSPNFMVAPVWLLKSGWTAKLAATYHLMQFNLSAPKVSLRSLVPFRYFISLTNLFQSASLGSLTLVHSTAIVCCMSGLARFHRNRAFATIVWYISTRSWCSFLPCPSLNRASLAGIVAMFEENVSTSH